MFFNQYVLHAHVHARNNTSTSEFLCHLNEAHKSFVCGWCVNYAAGRKAQERQTEGG